MKKNFHIAIIGAVGCGLSHALERTLRERGIKEVVLIDNLNKETKKDINELLKREPIIIECYNYELKSDEFKEYKVTSPIDAIASRHKYPRKKNEW